MKIDSEKWEAAFKSFTENPGWAAYYNNAPSDECKDYIKFTFYSSEYNEPKDRDERKQLRDFFYSKLGVKDWKYIMDHAGNSPLRAVCQAYIDKLSQKA